MFLKRFRRINTNNNTIWLDDWSDSKNINHWNIKLKATFPGITLKSITVALKGIYNSMAVLINMMGYVPTPQVAGKEGGSK